MWGKDVLGYLAYAKRLSFPPRDTSRLTPDFRYTTEQLFDRVPAHEAGHAVAAAILRIPFKPVTAKPRGDVAGCVAGISTNCRISDLRKVRGQDRWRVKSKAEFDAQLTDRIKRRSSKLAVVVLAGRVADEMFFGQHLEESFYDSDESTLRELAANLDVSGEAVHAWRNQLDRRTRELFSESGVENAVSSVAEEIRYAYYALNTGVPQKRVQELVLADLDCERLGEFMKSRPSAKSSSAVNLFSETRVS